MGFTDLFIKSIFVRTGKFEWAWPEQSAKSAFLMTLLVSFQAQLVPALLLLMMMMMMMMMMVVMMMMMMMMVMVVVISIRR